MTPGEVEVTIKAHTDFALMQRKWMDTMAADITATLIQLQGGDATRNDRMCYRYEEPEEEPVEDDNEKTVSAFKAWVDATGGSTI